MNKLTVNDINENTEEFLKAGKISNRLPKGLEKVAMMDSGLAHHSTITAGHQEGGAAKISGVILSIYLDCPGFPKNGKSVDTVFL